MNVPVSQVFGSGKLACRGVAIGISHSGEIIWSMEMSMAMLETAVEGVKCKAISFYRKGKLTPKWWKGPGARIQMWIVSWVVSSKWCQEKNKALVLGSTALVRGAPNRKLTITELCHVDSTLYGLVGCLQQKEGQTRPSPWPAMSVNDLTGFFLKVDLSVLFERQNYRKRRRVR